MKRIFTLLFFLGCFPALAQVCPTCGSTITVQQAGSTIVNAATTVNFASGATVTQNGNVANVNISGGGGGVTSFNTRTGAITLGSTDVTSALGFTPLPTNNPTATGILTAPTVNAGAINATGNILGSAVIQGLRVDVNGAQVPTNPGIYAPATNVLGFASNGTAAGTIDATQHWRIGGAGTPTIAANACGSTTQGTIASGGNDQAFQVTVGTALVTSCTITFSSAFGTAPREATLTPANATAAAAGTTVAFVSSLTTTAVTISATAIAGASYYVQIQ